MTDTPAAPTTPPTCSDCGVTAYSSEMLNAHYRMSHRAEARAVPPSEREGLRAALERLDHGDEGEGCHWCSFSEGHDAACPVADLHAALAAGAGSPSDAGEQR